MYFGQAIPVFCTWPLRGHLHSTSSFSIKKLHRVADLWPRHVKWCRPVKNAVHISNLYRPRFWQVDSPEVLLIDGPLLFSIWMASGPHVAMIFYPPFSTTHFFLLISLAYTYAYHRIVISQQRWDPEQHFDVKKQGWSFDKILSTRDSKYMQHFYWNGGSTFYSEVLSAIQCVIFMRTQFSIKQWSHQSSMEL